MTTRQTDVLIIGGGPAGTTVATLAAERGWRVSLLEKDRHPRFHIGESLLPMTLPLLDRLGVGKAASQLGVEKNGADFVVGNSGAKYQMFEFAEALGEHPPHAYEVRRSEFDEMLFQRCAAGGADAQQEVKVEDVRPISDGRFQVTAVDAEARQQVWHARFVVDASGRDTFLGTMHGWKKHNQQHATAAVFAHFRDVTRRPGAQQGNISIVWFDHGWVWLIPLRNDVMSIGAVCTPHYLRGRRNTLDEFLQQTLDGITEVRERMVHASRINDAQATGNYSYRASRNCAPGMLLVGDAFTFIDPVFSSGVFLAMSSAERAIPVIDAWLQGDGRRYKRASRRYARDVDRAVAMFSWFIYRFTTPAMRYLFSNPSDLFGIRRAVTSMLAGDVYDNPVVRRRLIIFKGLYAATSLVYWRATREMRKAQHDRSKDGIGDQYLAG